MTAAQGIVADTIKSICGSRHARAERARSYRQAGRIAASLSALGPCEGERPSEETPIFIFSAGWRSGSTLVQRLLMSGDDTLIWGEAFDRSCIVQRLTDTIRPFTTDWPAAAYFRQPARIEELSQVWVANLYPPIAALKAGYRALIEQVLREPAKAAGAMRWGFKEVRLGIDEACFLRWLFPRAKFVFVYRSPYTAYASYKAFQPSRNWYVRWPDQPAFTAFAFGRHWRRLAADFTRSAVFVDALVVRYEDLISGRFPVERLGQHCEVAIDRRALEQRVGGPRERSPGTLNLLERRLIDIATYPIAGQLGYHAGRGGATAQLL